MYHPEYQVMNFESPRTFNVVNNTATMQIFQNIGLFIYKEVLRNRLNSVVSQTVDLSSVDDLWGTTSPMVFDSNILISAYAIPTNATALSQ
jgi:hypothetical protein